MRSFRTHFTVGHCDRRGVTGVGDVIKNHATPLSLPWSISAHNLPMARDMTRVAMVPAALQLQHFVTTPPPLVQLPLLYQHHYQLLQFLTDNSPHQHRGVIARQRDRTKHKSPHRNVSELSCHRSVSGYFEYESILSP